jgi:hypothetical protein
MSLTAVPRALDTQPISIGIRTALLANPTIAAAVGTGIYPNVAPPGSVFPYIVYLVVSDLTQGWYSHAGINGLWQITAVDRPAGPGYSTTLVSSLGAAIQTTVFDTKWSVAGWNLTAVTREQAPPYTTNEQGVIIRYVPVTARIQAYHL